VALPGDSWDRFDEAGKAGCRALFVASSVFAPRRQHDEDEQAASVADGEGVRLLVSRFNGLAPVAS